MRHPLHALCPYFAMFPEAFVARHIQAFTRRGDYILDPFCGRGTTILESLLSDRRAVGCDINPVAFCVSGAKAEAPQLEDVLQRIARLKRYFERDSGKIGEKERETLPEFFDHAFHPGTLAALLFLRKTLKWRTSPTDRFVAALVLGSLHGEMDKSSVYFSNQMPRTISTKPAYSIQYWKNHNLRAPRRDVFALLAARANYRLIGGVPERRGEVAMVDAREAADEFGYLHGKVKAVITSPPYLNVTRFEEDQWLRLWFLGYEPNPTYSTLSMDDRHSSQEYYWNFLADAWEGIAPLLGKHAVLVCRIAGKDITRRELTDNLYETVLLSFPRAYLICPPKVSKIRNKQSNNFRPGVKGCFFELDHIFSLN
ncbi:MAG: DNA methyltransferase [Terriglobales bacterium]|jgi:hypothetical protein